MLGLGAAPGGAGCVGAHLDACTCVRVQTCVWTGIQPDGAPLLGALSRRGCSRPAGRGALSPPWAAVAPASLPLQVFCPNPN